MGGRRTWSNIVVWFTCKTDIDLCAIDTVQIVNKVQISLQSKTGCIIHVYMSCDITSFSHPVIYVQMFTCTSL